MKYNTDQNFFGAGLRLPYKSWDAAVQNQNLFEHYCKKHSIYFIFLLDFLGRRKSPKVDSRLQPSIGSHTKVSI
jgi:hypothetical protein